MLSLVLVRRFTAESLEPVLTPTAPHRQMLRRKSSALSAAIRSYPRFPPVTTARRRLGLKHAAFVVLVHGAGREAA
jgi:hypothetical protein